MFLLELHGLKMFEASSFYLCMFFSSFQPESSIRFAEFAVIAIASKTYQRPLVWDFNDADKMYSE